MKIIGPPFRFLLAPGLLRRDSPTRGGRSWVQTAGPSASSAVLQAVTAALAERPSRYGRLCLGGDCGCNLKLREAGLAIYRALLHRDSLFWQGNSWSALTDDGNSTHSMITAVKDLPSRSKTFDAVDLYFPNVIGLPVGTSRQTSLRLWTSTPHVQLFKSKKGSVGQKLQSINWPTPDVTEQRSVVLKGIPIVLGDDSKDFFKTCFDTTRDEALSSVTVGVLFSAKTVLRRVRATQAHLH
ncbi:hypothetical protein CgunFtcFv8_002313 [Champsocephalus gunnari]|uniref:Uncharacterized protein n=1 Tax=Champsocephalus gunnari TaxID=52237 RepID=A0AAN8CMH7_CHAGU|nr:hypothetical protein CgunFtcFv8_002313 [Champsocephalus gunnari]